MWTGTNNSLDDEAVRNGEYSEVEPPPPSSTTLHILLYHFRTIIGLPNILLNSDIDLLGILLCLVSGLLPGRNPPELTHVIVSIIITLSHYSVYLQYKNITTVQEMCRPKVGHLSAAASIQSASPGTLTDFFSGVVVALDLFHQTVTLRTELAKAHKRIILVLDSPHLLPDTREACGDFESLFMSCTMCCPLESRI